MPLPIMTINLKKICEIGEPDTIFHSNARVVSANEYITGWGYSILYDDACQNARDAGLNLDSYLTAQIAFYMNSLGKRKNPVMVWLGAVNFRGGMIFLYITSCRRCRGLMLRGAEDMHTRAHLRADTEPFMYYDGENIFRVYWHHGEIKDFSSPHLLCDLGAIFPGRVGYGDELAYDRIINSPLDNENICYSPVPSKNQCLYEWKGEKMKVNHAFCVLDSQPPMAKEDDEDDEDWEF